MRKSISGLAAALALAAGVSGCGHEISPGTAEQTAPLSKGYIIQTAELGSRGGAYEVMGTVTARVTASVSAKVMGDVERVLVKEGDRVPEGAVLALIDRTQVEAQAEQARAGRDMARAQASLARTTYRRFEELRGRESVSAQEFDEVRAQWRQADAAAEQAEAAYKSALAMAEDAAVRAPFAGRVAQKLVEEGDLASPGRPLFVIEDESDFQVEFFAPESLIAEVSVGGTVRVVVDSLAGAELSGTITAVAPAADPRSRSFLVKAALAGAGGTVPVRSGMFARVMVPMAEAESMTAPAGAVVARGQLTGMYLVDAGGRARFRLVRVGRGLGETVEIVSGLQAGGRYVANPSPDLEDGALVEGTP